MGRRSNAGWRLLGGGRQWAWAARAQRRTCCRSRRGGRSSTPSRSDARTRASRTSQPRAAAMALAPLASLHRGVFFGGGGGGRWPPWPWCHWPACSMSSRGAGRRGKQADRLRGGAGRGGEWGSGCDAAIPSPAPLLLCALGVPPLHVPPRRCHSPEGQDVHALRAAGEQASHVSGRQVDGCSQLAQALRQAPGRKLRAVSKGGQGAVKGP
jgi:hypothetical protein